MDAIQAARADHLYPKPSPSARVGVDRRCDYPGCITKLSTYNPDSSCYVHSQPRTYSFRADRRAKGWG